MATSGSFNTNAIGNFYATVSWYRTGYSSENNEHYINYSVVAHNTPGNYRSVWDRKLIINEIACLDIVTTTGTAYHDGDVITSGTLTIPGSNSAGDGNIAISFQAGVGSYPGYNSSGEDSWALDRIPRYANFTEHYIYSTALNSISVHWSADANCDWVQYSLNGGAWINAPGNDYTISGLAPNTQYNIRTRIRRTDSQLWTTSGYIYGTTKDIAKVSSYSNFNLGDNTSVSYTNPSGNSVVIGIYATDASTPYAAYRAPNTNPYTFSFTDEELDTMYKAMGQSNSLSALLYLRTAGDTYYYDVKPITVTLTGNQKTGNINVNGSWKRTKKWVNVSDSWKRCVRWVNVNGSWKRCA